MREVKFDPDTGKPIPDQASATDGGARRADRRRTTVDDFGSASDHHQHTDHRCRVGRHPSQ